MQPKNHRQSLENRRKPIRLHLVQQRITKRLSLARDFFLARFLFEIRYHVKLIFQLNPSSILRLMRSSMKWQQYKYAAAAFIAIIVFSAFVFSYFAVALPAYDSLNNITIAEASSHKADVEGEWSYLISFNTGKLQYGYGTGYLNITNSGSQDMTLNLWLSGTVVRKFTEETNPLNLRLSGNIVTMVAEETNYDLGTLAIQNVNVKAHSSTIVPATLNKTAPIVNMSKTANYWDISYFVQASPSNSYLPWITLSRTYEFNARALVIVSLT